jgi:transposase
MPQRPRKQAQFQAERKLLATNREERIQKAIQSLKDNTFKKVSQAARHFGVSRYTVRHRIDGTHGPASKGQAKNRLLTEAQEEALCEWALYMAEIGEPMSKQALRAKVAELSKILQEKTTQTGKRHLPSKKWVYAFLDRNPQLAMRRPTGLDAVRARNFNPSVVSRHFHLLGEFLKKYDIPPENMYNMDEKGIQLGGGRKLDGTRYIFSQDQRNRVKTQGASLELVTTIECVAADGSNLKPCFVFTGKNVLHEGYFEEDGVL